MRTEGTTVNVEALERELFYRCNSVANRTRTRRAHPTYETKTSIAAAWAEAKGMVEAYRVLRGVDLGTDPEQFLPEDALRAYKSALEELFG